MKFYQYIIRSTQNEPGKNYFYKSDGIEPFYGARRAARRFASKEMATAYARTLLFGKDQLFDIEKVPELS